MLQLDPNKDPATQINADHARNLIRNPEINFGH
jgi:hypothetical protein